MSKIAEKIAGAALLAGGLFCWVWGWEVAGTWLVFLGVVTLL